MSWKQSFIEAKDIAKLQWRSFAAAVVVMGTVYLGSLFVLPGVGTYVMTVPPALLIAITALARVNDIGPEKMGWRWHLRRFGLVMSGAGAVMLLGAPFTETAWVIPWRTVVLTWGVGLAWFTTPEMPPWEDYISGAYWKRRTDEARRRHVQEFAGRVTGAHKVSDLKRRLGDGDGP